MKEIFDVMLRKYGKQGWWPKNGKYHPNDYSIENPFEVIIGAILTQNTAWTSVEKSLADLKDMGTLDADSLLELDVELLKDAIRPSGYFNQKAGYLRNIARFYLSLDGKIPTRQQLLQVKGVGKETADSILLYAYNQPEFVVDAYTKRIFAHLGLLKGNESYGKVKHIFEKSLPKEFKMFQEFHALIVEHGKKYYKKKPYNDPVLGKNFNRSPLIIKER